MTPRYFIGVKDIEFSNRRADESFLSGPEKEDMVRLFNKNAWETHYFPIVAPSPNRYGYVVEADAVPHYWRSAFRPLNETEAAI